MKKKINKKAILKVLLLLIIVSIPLLINMAFFRPTKLNAFIASKVYKAPANKAFTDDNFYKCVVDSYNEKNGTSVAYTDNLTDEQFQTITKLVCDNKEIISADGIEKLINLTQLSIENNQLTTLDVRENTALTSLSVDNNQLTTLDVRENTVLKALSVDNNQLTTLDVSENTALIILFIYNNQLTTLDVSQSTALTYLDVDNNQLTTLDVSENTVLKTLSVDYNQLTTLDVSENTALTTLSVDYNQLTTLDVRENTALTSLSVDNNQLTTLDVRENTVLKTLSVDNNQLTTLDVSENTALTTLSIHNNQLTTLDVSENTALTTLSIYNNQLTTLDVRENTALTYLLVDNNQLTTLDVRENTVLKTLSVDNNQLTTLDVSENTALTTLSIYNNQLTTLDVSQSTALTYLDVDNNQLTTLDVSQSTALTYLDVYRNPLKKDLIIYKGIESKLNTDFIKLPAGKTSSITSISSDDLIVNSEEKTIKSDDIGTYQVNVSYKHNISNYSNTYSGIYNVKVINITSDKYKINDNESYIYIGNDTNINKIKNNINIPKGVNLEIDLENNKLQVMWEENILKEFTIKRIDFGNIKAGYGTIGLSEEISHETFTSNITPNGVTYKIFEGDNEITSGNITKGMKLKVYIGEQVVDEYLITDEYLEFDESLNIDDVNNIIFKLKEGITAGDILSYISTSGEITIKNKAGNVIENSDIIGTGYKIEIELSSGTKEYTLVVSGDVTGDGIVNIADVLKIADHTINKNILTDYEELASEVTNDTNLNIADVLKIADYTLDKRIEIWR